MTQRDDSSDALLALANRCEREEPSHDLNKAIANSIGRVSGYWQDGTWFDTLKYGAPNAHGEYPKWTMLPDFTASLDAAVTLVQSGRQWNVEYRLPGNYLARAFSDGEAAFGGQGKTAALALCAAALRARSALAEGPAMSDNPKPKGITVTDRDIGRAVVYRTAPNYEPEQGTITSFNDKYVFVRYGLGSTSAATDPNDLDWIAT